MSNYKQKNCKACHAQKHNLRSRRAIPHTCGRNEALVTVEDGAYTPGDYNDLVREFNALILKFKLCSNPAQKNAFGIRLMAKKYELEAAYAFVKAKYPKAFPRTLEEMEADEAKINNAREPMPELTKDAGTSIKESPVHPSARL